MMAEDTDVTLGHCLAHNLRKMAIQIYFHLRIHIRAQYITEQLGLKKQFASKAVSAARQPYYEIIILIHINYYSYKFCELSKTNSSKKFIFLYITHVNKIKINI